ncbi:MAG TPA: SH3 domain-containing protein, partial [Thermomicrobiales bacterium]|nr:SH3 domain-containing protein [Thermomicrobiales bacterium]
MHSPRRPRVFACAVLLAVWLGISGLLAPSATLADTDLVIGGEAVVAYAQGDNVRVRDDATYDAGIITSVPEGTTVSVLDGPFSDGDGNTWYYVSAVGSTGYMVNDYLTNAGGGAPSGGTAGGTVTATDNVHLRSGPSVGYASIGKIPTGTSVAVLDSMDDWLRVSWNGFEGWSYGEFFIDGGSAAPAPTEDPAPAPEPEPEQEPEITWIDAGTRYTNDSVNFRSGPSLDSSVYELLPAGIAVELTGKSQNGFAEGVANGYTGWVSLDFLTATAPEDPEPDVE